jgi:predicted AAA+ superfamily ATPase
VGVEYRHRVLDRELDELLSDLPALAIEGAKGVGKTVTATRRAKTVIDLDDLGQLELVVADPAGIDARDKPVLLDEWQRHPPLWDLVRRRVDAGAAPGSYLLTGSAGPNNAAIHSGAGRIVSLRMRPLALAERGLEVPSVSLARMLSGSRPSIDGSTQLTLPDYVEEILASGFPGIRPLGGRARRAQLDGYLARVVERDFPEQGLRARRPHRLRAWLVAYAASTAATTSYNALLAAATPGESDKPAKTTTIRYRDVLEQLYLLDPVPGWAPGRGHLGKAGTAPKHHLADPALAARLLGVDAAALLRGDKVNPPVPRDGSLLGALFESLVTLSVRTYAQAAEARTRHLRTHNGAHEVDLIVERDDQRVVALEVKLSATVNDADVKHLRWLQNQLGPELLDAAVITTGRYAFRREDGIAVIPAALLGP